MIRIQGKKRKGFRRIVAGTFHWQWKVGDRVLVAYCDETGEKRMTHLLAPFLRPGAGEYPWGIDLYMYISPRCVAAWLKGEKIPPPDEPQKVQHPVYVRTYEKKTTG